MEKDLKYNFLKLKVLNIVIINYDQYLSSFPIELQC